MAMNFVKWMLCVCLLFVGIHPLRVHAQDAAAYFNSIPDTLLPLLTAVNRADCIDFLQNRMKAEVTNRFGSKSEMTTLTPDFISVQLTPQTTWQMKLLPLFDSTSVICVISTACAPVCDSSLFFYSTDWKPLSSVNFLTPPQIEDFFNQTEAQMDFNIRLARKKADMLLMKADFSRADTTLTFTLSTPEYMPAEDAEKLKPFIVTQRSYRWQEGRFLREDVGDANLPLHK